MHTRSSSTSSGLPHLPPNFRAFLRQPRQKFACNYYVTLSSSLVFPYAFRGRRLALNGIRLLPRLRRSGSLHRAVRPGRPRLPRPRAHAAGDARLRTFPAPSGGVHDASPAAPLTRQTLTHAPLPLCLLRAKLRTSAPHRLSLDGPSLLRFFASPTNQRRVIDISAPAVSNTASPLASTRRLLRPFGFDSFVVSFVGHRPLHGLPSRSSGPTFLADRQSLQLRFMTPSTATGGWGFTLRAVGRPSPSEPPSWRLHRALHLCARSHSPLLGGRGSPVA